MKSFLFLILFVYAIWLPGGRSAYIRIKYHKETGILLPIEVNRDELMEKLQQNLHYPALKEIFYDELGRISLRCKFGTHSLRIEGRQLFVGKSETKMSSRVRAHYIEEAECLKAYIQKIFNPDAPVNPSAIYQKLKNFRRNSLIASAALIILCAVLLVIGMDKAGITDNVASQSISTSYLSQYSTTTTVGEAFSQFFSNPEWVSYKDGAQQMVDFKGGCIYGGDPATVIITFTVNQDAFRVEEIKVNGEPLPEISYDALLQSIYEG